MMRFIVLFILIISFGFLFAYYYVLPKWISREEGKPVKTMAELSTRDEPTDKDKNLEQFFTDYYLDYSNFSKQVPKDTVSRAFPIHLRGDYNAIGWVAEVEEVNTYNNYPGKAYSYYLLTPEVEKKLEAPISCVTENVAPHCSIDNAQAYGYDSGYIRELKDSVGYLVLSVGESHCSCYGGAGSGSVSVYELSTGEKVKLQNNFKLAHISNAKGISDSGNSVGVLRGVFGIARPLVVVDYGGNPNDPSEIDDVSQTAYFDLQTGARIQLIEFK